ncbi:MAG: 50S ribosomal protein L11 methyltransferase [Thermoplasmatales archaeon]|nr:50S ribosomal protein L11 methyltransferase [Thermoplasmatales archaeon]
MKKKELEILLQKIEREIKLKENLEQYITPAEIASDILWIAREDIKDKVVIDLGCGTGIFSIGSAILNAKKVIGIDIDENLVEIAKKEAEKIGVKIDFFVEDVENFNIRGDVAIMNPPFGAQYAGRHADRIFLKKAIELTECIYSLHLKSTEDFLKKFIEDNGWEICYKKEYKFPLKASLPFHKKRIAYYDVIMINLRKAKNISH